MKKGKIYNMEEKGSEFLFEVEEATWNLSR